MKHLIKIESTPHGVLGVRHTGLDQQYCEAGELVILEWQPDAKWGLQEAHYTDGDGNVTPIDLTRVKVDGVNVVAFVMPDKDITIGGTFKLFVIEDWTGSEAAFSIVGSFDVANLPTLDGFNDAGKVAFVKDTRKYATWDGYGWTYMDGKPVTPRYLTFTANEDGSSVGFIVFNDGYDLPEDYKKPSLQYSTDDGKTWQDYDLQISDSVEDATKIELDEGESVMFKGVNENLAYFLEDDGDWLTTRCYVEGSVAASGDVTSLLNGVGGDIPLANNCYSFMFDGCTGLTQAPALPATTLANNCYNGMFRGCTGLMQAPALPATTLAQSCYSFMFSGCTGLTQAPALPATTLANNCYNGMFNGCTGLTQAPTLPATTLANNCYNGMFNGCTGLMQAPALPATTLADYCYQNMFNGCTGLTQAPTLPATTLANGCYSFMFDGCTGITSHDVAALNNSANTFNNNTSCASFTIHADTPPTIGNNTITGLKADCIIYVPAESVDAYKAKQYWSARASYIQAIQ